VKVLSRELPSDDSLLVFVSAVGQNRVSRSCLLLFGCVDTASVSQLNVLARSSFLVLCVLFTAIEKCGHDSESEWMSKSPFHGLARTASCEMQGERFVAVATESLCTQALCACSSTGYKTQASAWAVLLKEDAGHREASYCYKAR